jgi:serine/threonine-protein kinase
VPEDRVLGAASALAEGSEIDWPTAEREAADEGERSIVRELRVLADIAELARNPSSRRTGPLPHVEPAAPPADPVTWGHLRIIGRVGEGSFGTVYTAFDTRLEREVALKLIRPSSVSPEFDLSRTLKEARLLARVRHHGVVNVLGADYHDSRFGLWMELVRGHTLQEHLALNGTMSGQEAAVVGVDLCHALAAVHGAGLLHRDIKATNVMREDGGRIVLMDFGAGRPIPSPDDPAYTLAGTPQYLAPELLAGQKPSVASDIYSVGVLLFHMVSAAYPFLRAASDPETGPGERQRVFLRDLRPALSSSFADVVERALLADPGARYKTAGEFGAALAGVAGMRYEGERARRSPWLVPAATVAGLALVAGLVYVAQKPSTPAAPGAGIGAAATAALAPAAYEIGASLHAVRDGQNVRLAPASRVQPGDQLYLTLETSHPVFVYVVNQDDTGNSFLLFPLPGYEPGNPIPPGATNRLPGARDGEQHYWQVTSAGGREHFLIYAAPQRLGAFEQILTALPRAELGRSIESVPLSAAALNTLRGVGGVVPGVPAVASIPTPAELQPLADEPETTTGVWARRITLENPPK